MTELGTCFWHGPFDGAGCPGCDRDHIRARAYAGPASPLDRIATALEQLVVFLKDRRP